MYTSAGDGRIAHAQRGTSAEEIKPMHMAIRSRSWTRADLERLPEDGNKYEIIHGALAVSPAPSPAHDALVRVIRRRLEAYLDRNGIAEVSDHMPAVVTADSEVIPDIVVREPVVPPPQRWDDAPLPMLVVEVLSESSRRTDNSRKADLYVEIGIPEYWIVDGDDRSIRVVGPAGERVERRVLNWLPPRAAQPLEIDLPALFSEALGAAR